MFSESFIIDIVIIFLNFCLQAAEDQLKDVEENFEQEKKELENKLLEKNNDENKLLARIESLTAESDFTKEQLSAMKAKYENIKNGEISGLIKPVKDSSGKFNSIRQFYQKYCVGISRNIDYLFNGIQKFCCCLLK